MAENWWLAHIFQLFLTMKRKQGNSLSFEMAYSLQDYFSKITRMWAWMKCWLWFSFEENSNGWVEFLIIKTKWTNKCQTMWFQCMAESKVNICVYFLFLTHVWSILVWGIGVRVWYKFLVRICTWRKSVQKDSHRVFGHSSTSMNYAYTLTAETGNVCQPVSSETELRCWL